MCICHPPMVEAEEALRPRPRKAGSHHGTRPKEEAAE